MAITYRGKAFTLNATAGLDTAVPIPSATVAGDFLVAVVGTIGPSAIVTAPAGWAEVAQFAPTTNMRTGVYTRPAVAGDAGATVTWSWSTSGRNFGFATAYAGVDTSVPASAQAAYAQQASPAPLLAPALAVNAGDWLITAAAGRENPGTDTAKAWSNDDPSDVERFDVYTTNAAPAIKLAAALWDSNRAVPGGSAQRTVTPSPLMQLIHLWSVRLASVGATTPPPPAPTGDPWSHLGSPLR